MKGQPESSGGNPNCGLPNTGRLQQQLFLSRMKDPQFAAEEHNVNYEDAFLEKETANDMSHPSPLPNASKMLPFLKTHTKHVLLQDLPPSRKARSGYGINILKHCTRLQKYGVVKIRRKYKTTDIYFDGEIKKCEKILATYKGRLAFLLTTQDLTGPIYTTEMDFKHGGPNLEVQQLSEKLFYLQLLKNREDILEKKKVELMNQRSIFLKIFSDTKSKMIEEEENFIKEITDFNNEYGLTCNRELLIRKKAKTEICDLETKANILKNEMESMERENAQLNALQLQKNELKQDLFTLQSKLKDTEEQLCEAEDITKCLEAEKVKVSEKPQTDIECLRIKKELDIYKEDDLENVCEALQTEIEFLQMKLSQKSSGK